MVCKVGVWVGLWVMDEDWWRGVTRRECSIGGWVRWRWMNVDRKKRSGKEC